ncbi:MAG: DedA family protein [Rubrivivax sp.]|nr:MAG: DedA family protein [Rubrivivax sp.]
MSSSSPSVRHLPWGRYAVLALYLAVIAAAVMAWRDPALRPYFEPQAMAAFGRDLLAMPLGPVMVLAGYVVAVLLAVPVGLLITVGALVFGPWPGMAYSLGGMVLGAIAGYGVGRWSGAVLVDRWTSNSRLHAVAQALKRRGLWAVIAIRVLPLAPFIMVNIAAGAFQVRLRDFVLGTLIGLAPGTVLISLFLDRLTAVWNSPDASAYLALGALVVLLVVLAAGVPLFMRWRASQRR